MFIDNALIEEQINWTEQIYINVNEKSVKLMFCPVINLPISKIQYSGFFNNEEKVSFNGNPYSKESMSILWKLTFKIH